MVVVVVRWFYLLATSIRDRGFTSKALKLCCQEGSFSHFLYILFVHVNYVLISSLQLAVLI